MLYIPTEYLRWKVITGRGPKEGAVLSRIAVGD